MDNVMAIVLAAGKETRMVTNKSKMVHKIYGKEMVKRVVDTAKKSGINEIVTVVGDLKEQVIEVLKDEVKYAYQEESLGTGHAVIQAREYLKNRKGKVVILYGDVPIIRASTIEKMVTRSIENNIYATLLTAVSESPFGYGRILRDNSGNVKAIIEEKDASEDQKQIREINSGIYCFDIEALDEALNELTTDNVKNEYYLTDVIKIMYNKGLKMSTVVVNDNMEILGVNDKQQLAVLTSILKMRINLEHMEKGVTIMDPTNTYIYDDVQIGMDTVIYPNTTIKSDTIIGENCEIGPYAYIRENCVVSDNAKVGAFVELKKTKVGKGSKVPHLSYLGDTELGEKCNIGCGTITCNYDGYNKSKTIIGDKVFVGSNVNLVAPVELGDNSFIAAGSTITENVPEYALSIARQKQMNKEGWNKKD